MSEMNKCIRSGVVSFGDDFSYGVPPQYAQEVDLSRRLRRGELSQLRSRDNYTKCVKSSRDGARSEWLLSPRSG